jgi:hypothetical protein
LREQGDAVFLAFAVTDDDLSLFERDIFDP